jgi:hypothetical protein
MKMYFEYTLIPYNRAVASGIRHSVVERRELWPTPVLKQVPWCMATILKIVISKTMRS